MTGINDLFGWTGLAATLALLAVAALLARSARARRLYSRREWSVIGKLSFIVVATMLMIAVHNAKVLPDAQFIYGRF